jgi:hypothetical protein
VTQVICIPDGCGVTYSIQHRVLGFPSTYPLFQALWLPPQQEISQSALWSLTKYVFIALDNFAFAIGPPFMLL